MCVFLTQQPMAALREYVGWQQAAHREVRRQQPHCHPTESPLSWQVTQTQQQHHGELSTGPPQRRALGLPQQDGDGATRNQ